MSSIYVRKSLFLLAPISFQSILSNNISRNLVLKILSWRFLCDNTTSYPGLILQSRGDDVPSLPYIDTCHCKNFIAYGCSKKMLEVESSNLVFKLLSQQLYVIRNK